MHLKESYYQERAQLCVWWRFFKLALYTANPYTTSSTVYSSGAGNEVSGSAAGYSTGEVH